MRAFFTSVFLWSICSTTFALSKSCPIANTSIIAHTGTPVGKEEAVDGGAILKYPGLGTITDKRYMQSPCMYPSLDAKPLR